MARYSALLWQSLLMQVHKHSGVFFSFDTREKKGERLSDRED